MTKICSKCGVEKDLSLFSLDAQGKSGRKSACKECLSKSIKEWSSKPEVKQRNRQTAREYVKNYPETKLMYSARDRSKKKGMECIICPDDIIIPKMCPILGIFLERGDRKDHNAAPSLDRINPDLGYIPGNVAVISDRANRIKNDGTAEDHRKVAHWISFGFLDFVTGVSQPKNLIKWMVDGARRRSKRMRLSFNLTREDIVVPEVCPILGIPLFPGVGQRKRHDGSPSLDRVDPVKGYVKGNVGVISYKANRIKNNGTAEEHLKIANWMDSMIQSKQPESNYEEAPSEKDLLQA
jgi:hypothetical protein